jgi:hypothetical protein
MLFCPIQQNQQIETVKGEMLGDLTCRIKVIHYAGEEAPHLCREWNGNAWE